MGSGTPRHHADDLSAPIARPSNGKITSNQFRLLNPFKPMLNFLSNPFQPNQGML
jgi:hypothetical protein